MKVPIHISLDIETLSTRAGAVVISIGMALIDTALKGIEESFEVFLDIQEQLDSGAIVDDGALRFWMMQERSNEWATKKPEGVKEALLQIEAKIASWQALRKAEVTHISEIEFVPLIWCWGANFDGIIIRELCARHHVAQAWEYWQERCLRTLACSLNDHTAEPPSIPKPDIMKMHRALYDATYQAEILIWCFNEIKRQQQRNPPPEVTAVNEMLLREAEQKSAEYLIFDNRITPEGFTGSTSHYQCRKCTAHFDVPYGKLIASIHWHDEWNSDGSEMTRGYINQ